MIVKTIEMLSQEIEILRKGTLQEITELKATVEKLKESVEKIKQKRRKQPYQREAARKKKMNAELAASLPKFKADKLAELRDRQEYLAERAKFEREKRMESASSSATE